MQGRYQSRHQIISLGNYQTAREAALAVADYTLRLKNNPALNMPPPRRVHGQTHIHVGNLPGKQQQVNTESFNGYDLPLRRDGTYKYSLHSTTSVRAGLGPHRPFTALGGRFGGLSGSFRYIRATFGPGGASGGLSRRLLSLFASRLSLASHGQIGLAAETLREGKSGFEAWHVLLLWLSWC